MSTYSDSNPTTELLHQAVPLHHSSPPSPSPDLSSSPNLLGHSRDINFPSRAEFDSHMTALGAGLYAEKNDSVAFLDAMFRILSGDSNAGLDALVDLQESDRVGSVAKKAFMHFVGLRFQPTPVEETTDEKARTKKSNESL